MTADLPVARKHLAVMQTHVVAAQTGPDLVKSISAVRERGFSWRTRRREPARN